MFAQGDDHIDKAGGQVIPSLSNQEISVSNPLNNPLFFEFLAISQVDSGVIITPVDLAEIGAGNIPPDSINETGTENDAKEEEL